MPEIVQESATLAEATVRTDAEGPLLEVEFLTAGWGSSGYYSPDIVEAAAPLFTAGTQMYFDHPTADEERQRPARSVRDLCAVVVEAATYNPETRGLRGVVRPFNAYADLFTDTAFLESIGLSIRASADRIVGEAEGREGLLVQELEYLASVDVVTRAGRGGKVLALLESAPAHVVNDRAIAHGVEEATADERRTQLSDAVRTAYGDDTHYAWVQDFDDEQVWFQASGEAERARYWQQTYTVADDDMSVTLTGERTEVRPVTRYLPVASDGSVQEADPITRPGSTQEDNMPQIEEAEHQRLTEAAGRVPQLEEQLATETARGDRAESELAAERRGNRARAMLGESEHAFNSLETTGLLAELPANDDGTLNEDAFTTRVNEAAARRLEEQGAGRVRGMGGEIRLNEDADPAKLREESDNVRRGAFGRTEVKGA